MDIKDRLKEIRDYAGMGQTNFEKHTGIASGYFNKIKGSIGSDTLLKIAKKYPEISLDWVITGEGPMLKEESDSLSAAEKVPDNYRLVPLYNLDAVGGLHGSNLATLDNQYVEELVPFEDARVGDVSLWVTGESMIPTCPPGSKILIRKVVDWREYFGFGNMFVLLLNDGRRILKEVVKSEENPKTHVLCKSHNPKYSPEELPKSKIEEVWKVIQVHITKGW